MAASHRYCFTDHRPPNTEHRTPKSRPGSLWREDIDGHAKRDEPFVGNRTGMKERRVSGRIDEEVEIAFARIVAPRCGAEHPRIRSAVS